MLCTTLINEYTGRIFSFQKDNFLPQLLAPERRKNIFYLLKLRNIREMIAKSEEKSFISCGECTMGAGSSEKLLL
ncbi:hypothetical protein A3SI_18839 [Nitritalea halalkaliphila LW7]|uniref:Uncharacterized protein n=1 Tax=Nitritalea halalkaliphila LW7 TaxID=1189621 RepID=I5BTT7_9BACT|nr:hypothetical protein A3SI_18839 [Nitritalea halalkaliphila LW7]